MEARKQLRINELTIKMCDQTISPEQVAELESLLQRNREAIEYFVDCSIDLKHYRELIGQNTLTCVPYSVQEESETNKPFDDNLWKALSQWEQEAPAIEMPKLSSKSADFQRVYPKVERQPVSKITIAFGLLSAAAMLFLLLFVNLAPINTEPLVGRLSKTINAQWQDPSGQIVQGCDLYAGPMNLTSGFAEILLDNGAIIDIQAPCQFSLESTHQIYLQQGQVVALYEGHSEDSFLVRTPNASVVDYGTEFGVRVSSSGQTDAFVYRGQVQLRDSSNPIKFTDSVMLKAGQGAQTDSENKIRNRKIDPTAFVRHEELEARYYAQNDHGYHRWKASIYQLHRDPSLVAHYFYEKQNENSDVLINSAIPESYRTQGNFGESNAQKPLWVQGRWPQKQAVSFDRSHNSVIVIPSEESLSFTYPLTISVWVCFPDSDQWGGHLISCRDGYAINYQFSIFDKNYSYSYQQNRLEFRQYNGDESRVGYYSKPFIPQANKWYHVVVVFDGSELRFYVDGKLFEKSPYKGMPESVPAKIVIGAVQVNGEYILEKGDFNGIVDELMVFKRSLSDNEILDMYKAGKP